MKIGTKSVLFGGHQFLIHPWFVAAAWWRLYGFPWDPRLWLCFFVHDLGYWGKPNMDGPEGEEHPVLGARVVVGVCALFGASRSVAMEWHDFCLYHSRFLAKRHERPYSRLCVADKLAIALTPWWLYRILVGASGEWREYVALSQNGKHEYAQLNTSAGLGEWYLSVQEHLREWALEHADLKPDTWTPGPNEATP